MAGLFYSNLLLIIMSKSAWPSERVKIMNLEEFFKLSKVPLPDHPFDAGDCTFCSNVPPTSYMVAMRRLPGVDRGILDAASRVFRLDEKDGVIKATPSQLEMINLFCNGLEKDGRMHFRAANIQTGKKRLRHALLVYRERLMSS